MMPDFNRETRYIVVKLARLDHESRQAVIDFLQSWHVPTEECVVVEHDWPNYEHTWQTIQQVAEGTFDPNREASLLEELERRKEQINSAAKVIQDLQCENKDLRAQAKSMVLTQVMAYEFVKLMDDNADSPDTPDALFSLSVLADRFRHQLQHFEESPNDQTN